ncbi:hypothetical protein DPMN_186328 [Dreissena polymorpha]|uniref:Uncharacterized protein n=1 Tax=Dreissena polymorpha TaxID=45954 RepID=A0A9D4DMQ3_DREPO|nr:hypothetical protein DPMN_186328 [Dreissena polymorpha]
MGYSDQAIMAVTGHRNSASLASYIKPDDVERHNVSTALHLAGHANSNRCLSQKELTNVASHVNPSNHPFAITQSDAQVQQPMDITLSSNSRSQSRTLHMFTGNISSSTINLNIHN